MTLNRSIEPPYKEITGVTFQQPEMLTLENGVPLYHIPDDGADILRLDLLFDAGNKYGDNPAVALAAVQLLTEGTEKMSSQTIAYELDNMGAEIHVSCDKDYAFVSLVCLSRQAPKAMEILEQLMLSPTFPEDEVSLYATNAQQRLLVDMQKVSTLAKRKLQEILFGENHYYGRQIKPENYKRLSRDVLGSFFSHYYTANRLKVLLGGKCSESVLAALNRIVGRLPLKASQDTFTSLSTSPELRCFVSKKEAVQSSVRIGMPMVNRSHPDFIRVNFVNLMLGGFFGSRLMKNIREQKGYTYGIGSAIIPYKDQAFLAIASEVKAGKEEAVVEEVFYEMERLKNENISEDEIKLVKNYYLGGLLRGLDGMMNLCDHFRYLILEDITLDYYSRIVQEVQEMNSSMINELSKKYLDEKTSKVVVAGNLG